MTDTRIERFEGYMKLSGHTFNRVKNKIQTATAVLEFESTQVRINRHGKISRTMPYARMNLDRLVALVTT